MPRVPSKWAPSSGFFWFTHSKSLRTAINFKLVTWVVYTAVTTHHPHPSPKPLGARCYKNTSLNLHFPQNNWFQFGPFPFLVSLKQVRSWLPCLAKPASWCVCLSFWVSVCRLHDKILPPAHRGRVAGKEHQMIPCPSSSQGCCKRVIEPWTPWARGHPSLGVIRGGRDSLGDAEKEHYLLSHLAPNALVGGLLWVLNIRMAHSCTWKMLSSETCHLS